MIKKVNKKVNKRENLLSKSKSKSKSTSISESNRSSISNSIRNKFMYYPEISDDDFYERIYTKKEFHNHIVSKRPKADKNACNPKSFIPKAHQQFLRNFISPHTPYNGVLLVHGTGSGKTCTAITIAENFKDIVKKMEKKIVVITTLPKNFQKELFNERKDARKESPEDVVQCTGRDYELGVESRALTREQKKKEIMKKIYSYYNFFGYKEFANYIIKNTNHWQGDEESINEGIKHFISKNFDDTILIIDEVQNIKTDSGSLKKSIQPILRSIIKYARNLKLILMSATPMFDRQDEIIYLMNLLLINDGKPEIDRDEIFHKDQTLKPGSEEKLREIFKGYVSYIRGENPDSFPMKFFPNHAITQPDVEYDMTHNKIDKTRRIQYTPIVLCDMKDVQYNTYVHQLEKITKEGKLKVHNVEEEMNTEENFSSPDEESNSSKSSKSFSSSFSSSSASASKSEVSESGDRVEMVDQGSMSVYRDLFNIANITFPVENSEIGTYDKHGYSEQDDGTGGFYKVKKEGKKRSTIKFRYQSHAIFDKDTKAEAPFLDAKHLDKYSTKFATTLQSIIHSTGLNYVYSTYIDSGALPFALMLEQNGFERYTTDGETELLEYSPNRTGGGGKRLRICYKCGNQANHTNHTDSKSKDYHVFRVAKYILYFGQSNDNLIKIQKEDAVAQFISPNNRYGEEIKVFIGTRATSEGLDFKMIRQIHILQPWYNLSRHEQIIGRGIRSCSHIDLPPEERNVMVYQYAVCMGGKVKNKNKNKEKMNKMESVDLYYYRIAENKDIIIKKIMRIMKECAIDCAFFKKQNVILDDQEKVDQRLPDGTLVKVSYADKAYSSMCDYMGNCDYPCNWMPDPKKKYVINEDTYNIHFGRQNVEEAKIYIKRLFHTGFHFILKDIESYLKSQAPHIGDVFIYKALDEMVGNKSEIILDMYKRKGYIIYRGIHYIFQPFDYQREDLLMLYRTLPQPIFPHKVDVDNYEYNYETHNKRVSKENKVKNEISHMDQERMYMSAIYRLNKMFDDFSYLYDSSAEKAKDLTPNPNTNPMDSKEFMYAILKTFMDDMKSHEFHIFMNVFIRRLHIEDKEDVNGNKSSSKIEKKWKRVILKSLHRSWIYFYRDIAPSKSVKNMDPNTIVGYVYDRVYYVMKNMINEDLEKLNKTSLKKSIEKVEFVQASKDLTYKIDKVKELQEKTNRSGSARKSGKYHEIYGKIEWDKNKDKRIFKIVDNSSKEIILTKKGKESLRAIPKGMVCSSFKIPQLKELMKKLKMPSDERVGIPFLCTSIQIFLRYKQELERSSGGEKLYFI